MQHELVRRARVPEPFLRADKGTLELGVRERLHLAAARADDVVVVLAVVVAALVIRRPCPDVELLHEPCLDEQVEHPVDARRADRPSFLAQCVEDLLGGEAAPLAGEQLHNGSPCAAAPIAGGVQPAECLLRPGHRVDGSASYLSCSTKRE